MWSGDHLIFKFHTKLYHIKKMGHAVIKSKKIHGVLFSACAKNQMAINNGEK